MLAKIAMADAWIVFDDVQYVAREWQNRARLRHFNAPDSEYWATMPVHRPRGRASLISAVMAVDVSATMAKLYKSVSVSYARSPYWPVLKAYLDDLTRGCETSSCLTDIDHLSTKLLFQLVGIDTPTSVRSSSMSVGASRSEKLARLCHRVGATTYVSGSGGRAYLDVAQFEARNIDVMWQAWPNRAAMSDTSCQWPDGSFIDYLARCGPDRLRMVLTGKGY